MSRLQIVGPSFVCPMSCPLPSLPLSLNASVGIIVEERHNTRDTKRKPDLIAECTRRDCILILYFVPRVKSHTLYKIHLMIQKMWTYYRFTDEIRFGFLNEWMGGRGNGGRAHDNGMHVNFCVCNKYDFILDRLLCSQSNSQAALLLQRPTHPRTSDTFRMIPFLTAIHDLMVANRFHVPN